MKTLYFLGIGGIGMSALARYAKHIGYAVYGYDRVRSALCQTLEKEGCVICYNDVEETTHASSLQGVEMVVYTPAIPETNAIYRWFKEHGVKMVKRAEILGMLTNDKRSLAIAGTHGKTTTSTLLAHILKQSRMDCSAFLGGISVNYETNLLLAGKRGVETTHASSSQDNVCSRETTHASSLQAKEAELVVVEADEFDRSFHQLTPWMAVVTATDADHLDIYGTHEAYLEAFAKFTSLIKKGGTLVYKKGIKLDVRVETTHASSSQDNVYSRETTHASSLQGAAYTYSITDNTADFHAENIRVGNGELRFDYVSPFMTLRDLQLGVPVRVNVENAVAAMALAELNGVTGEELRAGVASFRGVHRRFEMKHKGADFIHIDDYAHHPDEIRNSIRSVRELYADRKMVVVFQPHLYTRTRDFHREFAEALSEAEQVVLLDIYPARELPIEGVTSKIIYDLVKSPVKRMCSKEALKETLKTMEYDVVLTVGAGDIGEIVL